MSIMHRFLKHLYQPAAGRPEMPKAPDQHRDSAAPRAAPAVHRSETTPDGKHLQTPPAAQPRALTAVAKNWDAPVTPQDGPDTRSERGIRQQQPYPPVAWTPTSISRRLPAAVTNSWDWQMSGACRNLDSGVFFHPENERGSARTARESQAKQICATCPVQQQCRRHALTVREPYGIWGGLSESDRVALTGPISRTPRWVSPTTT